MALPPEKEEQARRPLMTSVQVAGGHYPEVSQHFILIYF